MNTRTLRLKTQPPMLGLVATFTLLLLGLTTPSQAETQCIDWSGPVRRTWIQKGEPAANDVTLCGKGKTCEIVVQSEENGPVQKAAIFLAGNIEKICGSRPKSMHSPSGDGASIRLVTLGKSEVPAEVDASGMAGQWESDHIGHDRQHRLARRR